MNEEICFIDNNGRKLFSQDTESHIELAQLILRSDEKLMEEYRNSRNRDMVDFLVMDKGYLKVSKIGYYYKIVTFQLSKVSDRQKRLLVYYKTQGYELDDLSSKSKDSWNR